jgi:hypothetical protein
MLGERVWIYDVKGRLLDTKKIRQAEMNLSYHHGVVLVKVSGDEFSTLKIVLP